MMLTFCFLTFTEALLFSSYPTGLIFLQKNQVLFAWDYTGKQSGSNNNKKRGPKILCHRKDKLPVVQKQGQEKPVAFTERRE